MSGQARVFIPDGIMRRSADEFSRALELVGQNYWHRARKGEIEQGSAYGHQVRGAFEAMQWLAGARPVPPGFFTARLRTRYDVLDVLRITELACNDDVGRWEQVVLGSRDGALEHFPRHLALGAREIYEWALGMRAQLGYTELIEEDVRAAREFFQLQLRRTAERDAADAVSPYAHLRGALVVSVTVFEQAVRDMERAYAGYRDTPMAPTCLAALKVGHWILGEAGHPVTGERTPVSRQAITDAVEQVVDAVYRAKTLDNEQATTMVDMLQYALGQREEPPVTWDGTAAGGRAA